MDKRIPEGLDTERGSWGALMLGKVKRRIKRGLLALLPIDGDSDFWWPVKLISYFGFGTAILVGVVSEITDRQTEYYLTRATAFKESYVAKRKLSNYDCVPWTDVLRCEVYSGTEVVEKFACNDLGCLKQ